MRRILSAVVGLTLVSGAGAAFAQDRYPELMGGPGYDQGPSHRYDERYEQGRYADDNRMAYAERSIQDEEYDSGWRGRYVDPDRVPDRYGPSDHERRYVEAPRYDHHREHDRGYGYLIPTYGYASQNYGWPGAACRSTCGGRSVGELSVGPGFFYDYGGVGAYMDGGGYGGGGGGYAVAGSGAFAGASARASASAYSSSRVNVRIGGRGGHHGGGCKGGCGGGKH